MTMLEHLIIAVLLWEVLILRLRVCKLEKLSELQQKFDEVVRDVLRDLDEELESFKKS